MFVTVAQSVKCRVCCLWCNIFISMVRCAMKIFIKVSVFLFFFNIHIFSVTNSRAVQLFFHRHSNAARVGNLGTRTLAEICPAEIWRYFYKKVSTCHLKFTEYFKIKCFHSCRGLYLFVLPLSSPNKTRSDAIQTMFIGWMCVPHSPPVARPVN